MANSPAALLGAQVPAWRLHHRIGSSEHDLARLVNPAVRGWMQYYGAFYRSALYPLLARINAYVMRWSRKKYKRLRGRKAAQAQWATVVKLRPRFSAHRAVLTERFTRDEMPGATRPITGHPGFRTGSDASAHRETARHHTDSLRRHYTEVISAGRLIGRAVIFRKSAAQAWGPAIEGF